MNGTTETAVQPQRKSFFCCNACRTRLLMQQYTGCGHTLKQIPAEWTTVSSIWLKTGSTKYFLGRYQGTGHAAP